MGRGGNVSSKANTRARQIRLQKASEKAFMDAAAILIMNTLIVLEEEVETIEEAREVVRGWARDFGIIE